MASKSSKRKSPASENDEKSPNSKCQKTKNGPNPTPAPTPSNSSKSGAAIGSVLDFLKDISVYILPASIEKTRMQIFKTQLSKYGGVIVDKFNQEHWPSHLIVDDKMEIDRMCRLLKLDKVPSDVKIVKTGWLSACFKSKTLVDLADFEIIVPKETPIVVDSKTKTEEYSIKSKKDVLSNNDTNAPSSSKDVPSSSKDVPSSSKDVPCTKTQITNPESDEGKNKLFPKVGVMFGAFKHANVAEADGGEESGDSDYVPSDKEDGPGGDKSDISSSGDEAEATSDMTENASSPRNTFPNKLPRGHWVCAQSSKTLKPNYNKHITDKLEEMVKTYQSTNDRWRALGYQKAIQAITKHPKQISSWEEAKSLPGVGARLADKVWEIAESGELRKLNEFKSSEELQVISLFTDVWGAGAHTARTWYQQGFRTLEDLKTKANLTKQQKIGLQHYSDFLDRMPRSEVEDILTTVCSVAEKLVPGTQCDVCGSYRRGKPTCGDIDILITHPDGKSHRGIFAKLLGRLREEGYLTDDLVSGEENGNQKKYMGVFRLKGPNRKHRRIDIIVTPVEEYACALVHFTGSAHFNRSIRHLAKKMNMSLSEHALRTGVIRKGGEKIFEGTALPTPTEEAVFKHMGIPYRPPDERDH